MRTIWNRINTVILLLVLFALLAVIAMLATGVRGGPLDPPGPPASTDSVRLPGTPISSIPYTITESGSYYLTRNLTVASGNGITIDAENVTLDLMGFALIGPGWAFPGKAIASNTAITRWNNTIRNGVIRDWNTGIATTNFVRSTYEDLRVTYNYYAGLDIGSGSAVVRVMSGYNIQNGIVITQRGDAWGGSVVDSNVSRNTIQFETTGSGILVLANNIWIRDTVIDSNGNAGAYVAGSYNEITDSRITGNKWGVYLPGGANLVARNALLGNTTSAVTDLGVGNRIATFVSDVGPSVTNPLSNVVY